MPREIHNTVMTVATAIMHAATSGDQLGPPPVYAALTPPQQNNICTPDQVARAYQYAWNRSESRFKDNARSGICSPVYEPLSSHTVDCTLPPNAPQTAVYVNPHYCATNSIQQIRPTTEFITPPIDMTNQTTPDLQLPDGLEPINDQTSGINPVRAVGVTAALGTILYFLSKLRNRNRPRRR
jgi:hypothetical protein